MTKMTTSGRSRRVRASLALLGFTFFACAHAPRSGAPERVATPHDLVLGPVNAYGGVVWFADELEPLEEAVAALLAKPENGGYAVVPLAELRALYANVREGRLPGVQGRCEASPPPSRLASHLHRGASEGEATVRCETDACTLTVIVTRPAPTPEDPDGNEETARFETKLDPHATPAAWASALLATGWARVPAPEPEGGLGIGGLMTPGQKPGVYAVVHDVTQVGEWKTALTSEYFQRWADQLDICHQTGRTWRDWWGQPFVVTVDALGKVGRCEAEHRDHLPPPSFECTCELLRRLDFGAGDPNRRARFYLDTTRLSAERAKPSKYYRGAYLIAKNATDRSAMLGTGIVSSEALATCLEPIDQELGEITLPARFEVREDGRSVAHHVSWAAKIPKDVRTCLHQVLAQAQFDCPLTGQSSVSAELTITVRPYGR